MLREVLDRLKIYPEGTYFDGTLGGGGHTEGILQRLGAHGRVIACDADPVTITRAQQRFANEPRLQIRHGYFYAVCQELCDENVTLTGVLLDLGVSSRQLDSDQIGLSYREEMPLDMRFDPGERDQSAADIINNYSPEDLATLFRTYGEEPAAWKIAQAIGAGRIVKPISTTKELREIIEEVIPGRFLIKTLSRVFQALRIAVNNELEELEQGLGCFIDRLEVGGRLTILTYHSLEDRIVKQKFRVEEKGCECPPRIPECVCGNVARLRMIPRKPIRPSHDEVRKNPRARSAKLRIAEKIVEK
ncbi:MAG: 16S rRNA (cytosine(1402)-N(4))-methyltransferase RsmH [Chlorobi bacterium]|nr:16S rRNA (cytosine(1402)-N(4))-methyltransferase RsmH [Chlorobiota bacterium]